MVAQAGAETVTEDMTMLPEVQLELCKKHGLESSNRWYENTPAEVVDNDE